MNENEPVGGTHFHMNGFTRRLVLTQAKGSSEITYILRYFIVQKLQIGKNSQLPYFDNLLLVKRIFFKSTRTPPNSLYRLGRIEKV